MKALVSASVDYALAHAVEEERKARGVSRSQVIEEALRVWVASRKEGAAATGQGFDRD